MKRILLSIMLSLPVCAWAQTVEECIRDYNFGLATQLLQNEIKTLTKKRQPTIQQEEQLRSVERLRVKMLSTEKVLFIDSVVVPRNAVYEHIPLSSESGKVRSYASHFQTEDSIGCSVFINQFANFLLLSKSDSLGIPHLYSSDRIGEDWTPLTGYEELGGEGSHGENYPYLLADGSTLYFAAQTDDGLGGYDIYMTRYDADEHRFLMPENIGMPFNSPANDYLYCVDDYFQLGWFVTDRNQVADSVCIYTFVPNDVRRLYPSDDEARLAAYARIASIRDTWIDEETVAVARQRLETLRAQRGLDMEYDFDFVLTDERVCHFVGDFSDDGARKCVRTWKQNKRQLAEYEAQLEQLRSEFHACNMEQRNQYGLQIRKLEAQVEALHQSIPALEKEIRIRELGKK